MDAMQVIEELGVPGRLPVEAIHAAQADRETIVPIFLRTIDDFLELQGPLDPTRCSSFFICSASGAKNTTNCLACVFAKGFRAGDQEADGGPGAAFDGQAATAGR